MGFLLRAGFVAAMSLATALPALADSRLFSVKADAPGVTVEQALVNGKPLAVSGKGGGVTFFRLDTTGDIPCTQRVTFVASTGARQDADVALCPQNWNFAVAFNGGAGAPTTPPQALAPAQPAAPPAPPPAAPVAAGTRIITIATDDPQVSIQAVYIDRQEATIVTRQGNGVAVQIAGGGSCQRDVGLKLSDGRTIARQMNICPANGSVLVMLGSGSEVAGQQPPAAPMQPAAPAMPAQPPLPPEPASSPAIASGAWSYSAGDGNAILYFGVPQSDDGSFSAACRLGSSQASVDVLRMVDGMAPNTPIQVTFFAGTFTRTYQGVGSPVSEMDGGSHPMLTIPASDPLWTALAKEAQVVVAIAGGDSFSMTLKGSSGPVRQFLAACLPAPPPVAAAPPVNGRLVNYRCDGGGGISVTFAPNFRTAFVAEAGAAPILLSGGRNGPSSAQFSNPPASLVGAGESIRWSRFGEPPRTCYPRG